MHGYMIYLLKKHTTKGGRRRYRWTSYSFSSIDKADNDEDGSIEDDSGIIDRESDDENGLVDDSNIDSSKIEKSNSTVSDLDQALRKHT